VISAREMSTISIRYCTSITSLTFYLNSIGSLPPPKIMFSSVFVCLSVSLFVSLFVSNFAQKLTNGFRCNLIFDKVDNGPMNNWLNFGGHPDHRLDTGIVFRIWYHYEIGKAGLRCNYDVITSLARGGGMHCPSPGYGRLIWNRTDHYIFILWFLLSFFFLSFFFPRLLSEVRDWMSAILPHMVWP